MQHHSKFKVGYTDGDGDGDADADADTDADADADADTNTDADPYADLSSSQLALMKGHSKFEKTYINEWHTYIQMCMDISIYIPKYLYVNPNRYIKEWQSVHVSVCGLYKYVLVHSNICLCHNMYWSFQIDV